MRRGEGATEVAERGSTEEMVMDGDDYVFRYPLQPKKGEPVYQDALLEMIRRQWENLLNLAIPVSGQREVKVDGFKLLSDRGTVYPVFPGSPYLREEPMPGVGNESHDFER